MVAHRPDYVVNSLEFQADGLSNYEIGSVNYATGEVGMEYRMKETGQTSNRLGKLVLRWF